MKILIHACPQRMWYVRDFLIPMLQEQGAEHIEVWNDIHGKGNLRSCMDSFAARKGDGGTWHIQDDVLPSRDFVQKCREYDDGVVYGFCCEQFLDRLDAAGEVYVCDSWHSFQCVRIPDEYARDCARWFYSSEWTENCIPELPILNAMGKGDDTFFREYLQIKHGYETALNLKPNIVDHVDWIIGGSAIHKFRDYIADAAFFEDKDLVDDLKERIKRYNSDDHI